MTQHDSTFNTSFTYRGNATSTNTPTSTVIRTFDIGGNVVTSKTNGVTTTTNTSTNSSTNYAAPGTLTTNSLTSSLQWSSFLGVSQATGPNGDVASMIYDSTARPSQSTSPYGAVTTYTYADSASPPYHQATTNNHWVQSQLDGFGRTVRAVTGYTSGSTNTTVSTVDTVYAPCGCSPMGKVSQVSLPYAPNGTEYWTTYTYDAIGRTTKVTLADGSATTYSYQGNTVAVTDAAGNVKIFTMDAFGNLITVQETDPSLGAVTTTYTYDVLNHLTAVSMPRGTNNQPRTFSYNSGNTVTGLLQSATNPKNGTVTYVYNSNNLLTSKTDAKNQQIQYTYDTYNRLTQVSHFPVKGHAEDTTQRVNYYYDTNPLDTTHTFSNYTSGRIAAVAYGPADLTAAPTFAEWYNYQISGLVATKRLQVNQAYVVQWPSVTDGSTSLNLDAAYTYDSGGEGKIASVAYPSSGPTYTYSFDQMYRPSGLKDQNNNTDVNNVIYNAASQLTSISYLGINESRTYNTLNQLTALSATQGSTVIVNKSYSYPAAANIGKITSQTDNISGEVVQYTYDSLNRLLQASTSAGSPSWSQAFTYDPYGNLTAKTGTGGAPAIPTSAQPSSYDANGNVTTTYGNQFAYDVENRMTKWTNTIFGTPIATYAYDTQNRRVWQWNGAVDSNGTPVSYSVYYYGPNGQRLGAYTLNVGANTTNGHITGYTLGVGTSTLDTYFGGRRLAPMDRLASAARVGNQSVSFYPYGEDKGTAGANDSWKFATYWRDSATSLDYAMNRYYSSGAGRFLTPDRARGSVKPSNPQSWNRYAYVNNDPTNRVDSSGLCDFAVAGITNSPASAQFFATYNNTAVTVYPYSSGSGAGTYGVLQGIYQVASQAFGPNSSTFAAIQGLLGAAAQGGPIDVITFSGGAAAFTAAVKWLNSNGASNIVSMINDITYVSPGNNGWLYVNPNTIVLAGNNLVDALATSGTIVDVPMHRAGQCGHDFKCIVESLAYLLKGRLSSPCPNPTTIFQPVPPRPQELNWWNLLGSGTAFSSFDMGFYWDFAPDDLGDDDGLTESVTSTFTPVGVVP